MDEVGISYLTVTSLMARMIWQLGLVSKRNMVKIDDAPAIAINVVFQSLHWYWDSNFCTTAAAQDMFRNRIEPMSDKTAAIYMFAEE